MYSIKSCTISLPSQLLTSPLAETLESNRVATQKVVLSPQHQLQKSIIQHHMSYYVQLKEVSIQRKKKNKTERKRKKEKLEPRRNRRKKRKIIIKRCKLAFEMANTVHVNHAASGHRLLHARSLVVYCLAHVHNHNRRPSQYIRTIISILGRFAPSKLTLLLQAMDIKFVARAMHSLSAMP